MWKKAPQNVIDLAVEIIKDFHPNLEQAKIGFLFREKAPISKGKITVGKASKVNDRTKVFLELDFIIWIAEDCWKEFSPEQKRAIIDHELSHCFMDGLMPVILRHDIEEFIHIIERHGYWSADLQTLQKTGNDARIMAAQLPMTMKFGNPAAEHKPSGKVVSIGTEEIEKLNLT